MFDLSISIGIAVISLQMLFFRLFALSFKYPLSFQNSVLDGQWIFVNQLGAFSLHVKNLLQHNLSLKNSELTNLFSREGAGKSSVEDKNTVAATALCNFMQSFKGLFFNCVIDCFAGGSIDHWPNKTPTSPIDTFMLPNNRDIRSSSATTSGMFGATGNRANALNGAVRSRNDSPSGATPHPNVVIDNLVRQWQLAEQRLLALIHNAYVPASDMTPAGKC